MNTQEQKVFDQMRDSLEYVVAVYDKGTCGHTVEIAFNKCRAALTAAKEVQAQVERDWLYIPRDCNVQCVAWRVSFNDGKTWTIWETDPQITDKAVMVQPLYTHSTCVSPQAQRLSDAGMRDLIAQNSGNDRFLFARHIETAFCSKNGIHLGD